MKGLTNFYGREKQNTTTALEINNICPSNQPNQITQRPAGMDAMYI